ncbi:MAG TPA: rRNA maturation RNase YbeY [Longimicrobiales bacterium]|nr:rRNA maturation RNase YbeY [Longimicrobiales bacterium]
MAGGIHVTVEASVPAFAAVDVRAVTERAVRATLADRDVERAEISVTLVDDAVMTAMNRQWKGRDATTDVLAFPLHEPHEPILGDVYLGLEQAARQAVELGEPPDRELSRLAIHGTLHVLGLDHPDEGREESKMWKHQERILATLGGDLA